MFFIYLYKTRYHNTLNTSIIISMKLLMYNVLNPLGGAVHGFQAFWHGPKTELKNNPIVYIIGMLFSMSTSNTALLNKYCYVHFIIVFHGIWLKVFFHLGAGTTSSLFNTKEACSS